MIIVRFLMLTGLLAVSACGSLSAPPQDTFYRLDIATPSTTAVTEKIPSVTFVAPFSASGLHSERALVYAHEDGTTLEQYGYHFWVDSPRHLLQLALSDYLGAALGVRTVTEPGRNVTHIVRGRIVRFERSGRNEATVAVHLDFYGDDPATALFSKRYERTIEARDSDAPAVVRAINTAVAEIFQTFCGDLRGLY